MKFPQKQRGYFDWVEASIILAIIALLIACGLTIYVDITSDKITLTKANWHCSKTESRTRLIPVGKGLMPQSYDSCIEYREK